MEMNAVIYCSEVIEIIDFYCIVLPRKIFVFIGDWDGYFFFFSKEKIFDNFLSTSNKYSI
jgi:hypothetical protein